MRVYAPSVPAKQTVKIQIPLPAGEDRLPDYVRIPAAIARKQLADYGCNLGGNARFEVKAVKDIKKVLRIEGVIATDLDEIFQGMVSKA